MVVQWPEVAEGAFLTSVYAVLMLMAAGSLIFVKHLDAPPITTSIPPALSLSAPEVPPSAPQLRRRAYGRISFYILFVVASAVRAVYFLLQLLIGIDAVSFWRSLNVILDKAPSFLFCSALTILLSIWGEMWASHNRLQGRFKQFVVWANVVLYILLVSLGVTQLCKDGKTPAVPGDPAKDMIPEQIALVWVSTVLYVPVIFSFFFFSYSLWSRALPARPQVPTRFSMTLHHLQIVAKLSMICLVLFILRTIVLICSNVFPDQFDNIWIELAYYLVLEVLPLIIMLLALNRTVQPLSQAERASERTGLLGSPRSSNGDGRMLR